MFKTTTYYYTPNKLVRNYLRLFHHISKNLLNRNIILDIKKTLCVTQNVDFQINDACCYRVRIKSSLKILSIKFSRISTKIY